MEKININLLNHIYQNAKMGGEAIESILPKVIDSQLSKDLSQQLNEYKRFEDCSKTLLSIMNEKPKDKNALSRISAQVGITANTLLSTDPSHIAELMINGSTMGIIEMTKKINDHPLCESSIKQLGQDIISFEQENINKLKSYL